MEQLIGLIIVGAIAFRGSCRLMFNIDSGKVLLVPPAFMHPPGKTFVHLYMVAAIPIALVNGFLLEFSWVDALIVGVGTWLGMLFVNLFLRFNEILQFLVFGLVNIAWLTNNIFD